MEHKSIQRAILLYASGLPICFDRFPVVILLDGLPRMCGGVMVEEDFDGPFRSWRHGEAAVLAADDPRGDT
jgi:hypothetical protein